MELLNLKFYEPYQYAAIADGTSGRVYFMQIPAGCVAFIEQVANNWFADTYLDWKIDGEKVEPQIQRAIAAINNPKDYKPPILAKNTIEWVAYNNSGTDRVFEVLCDGAIYHIDSSMRSSVKP